MNGISLNVPLASLTTLKAGGVAESFVECRSVGQLREAAIYAHANAIHLTVLGWGSNILPSDRGVHGLIVHNRAREIAFDGETVIADCGCGFQELFLKSAQANLTGLEFAVGIPGTLGGALVSNAGAYRSNVSALLKRLEIVDHGEPKWVEPEFMQFRYRDSILRSEDPPPITLLRVEMRLNRSDPMKIYDDAREFQRQRISKQPAPASVGSFFKNVYDRELADSLDNLPERLRSAGVVPSGYLIEKAGMKGERFGGAMLSDRHANFMLNVGGATASEIRTLASRAKAEVQKMFGVEIEEEALYIGDWSGWAPED